MNRSKAPARAAAALSVATIVLLASGCSFGGGARTSDPETSSPSQPEAQEAATNEQVGSAEEDKAAPITDTKTVTAPQSGISFAVPSDWQEISADVVASQDLASIAEELGLSEQELKAQMEAIDLMVIDTSLDSDFADNINVSKQVFPKSVNYDATVLTAAVQALGATAGEYSQADTARGKASSMTYTLPLSGEELHGAFIMVPDDKGSFAQITVTAGDAASTKDLMETVLSSLR